MAQTDHLARYPGHCYLETALFQRDSTQQPARIKIIDHIIHKRNIPDDAEKDKKDFPFTELSTCNSPIPDGSLQLIRFSGLTGKPSEPTETLQDRRVLASVFSALRFPLEHAVFALNSPRIAHGRLFAGDGTDADTKDPAFYAIGSRLCLLWRFETDTRTTRVVIVNHIPSVQLMTHFVPLLEAAMSQFNQCFGHPMFIGLPMVYFLRQEGIALYDRDSAVLSAIESQVAMKTAYRMGSMQQLRDLGRLVGYDKFLLSALRNFLDRARLFNERTYADKEANFKDVAAKHFLAHVEHQRDLIELDLSFLQSMQENITHQQTAISTIVNMQDGASMKTIAFITMVFLPGTFLASIFAMPVFPQGRDDTFWLYWAICLPLTAIVFLAWLAWFYWHTITRHDEDPQDGPLHKVKLWWQDVNEPKAWRTNDASYENIRRRLAGDTHKEWHRGFQSARLERSVDPVGTTFLRTTTKLETQTV